MRHRSVQSRAGIVTAAAVMAIGLGATAAQASFLLDLKISGGGKATTVAPGTEVTLDVWGTVTGAVGNAAAEGIQDVFFGIINSGNVGTIKPQTNGQGVALQSPFTGVATDVPGVTTSYGGTLYGTNASFQSVGSTNSASADNWVFARSTSMTTVTDGQETKLGTLTFKVDAAATAGSSGTLTLNSRTPSALVIPALWQEDGVAKDNGVGGGGTFNLGTAVTINVQAAGPVHNPGDVNGDGFVNSGDINAFIYALSNNAAAFASQYPSGVYMNADVNGTNHDGDGFVNAADINPFIAILSGTGEPGIAAALAAVPEPTSLGLVGLGALGMIARRKRA